MNETLEILNKVDAFYSNSFETLVTLTFSILAFAGILIPILLAYIQNRQLKIENALLSKKLEEEVSKHNEENKELIKGLINEEAQKIEIRLEKTKNELNKKIANSEAGLFHIQANHETEKYPEVAITSFCSAAIGYIESEDELNLQRVLNCIIKNCLRVIKKQHIEDNHDIITNTEELIEKLSQYNQNGRYSDIISDIKRELSQAQKREPA